jgi:hypothetical protein
MAITARLMICITPVLVFPAMCLAQAADEPAQWQNGFRQPNFQGTGADLSSRVFGLRTPNVPGVAEPNATFGRALPR